MALDQVDSLERAEMKLVGFSVTDSLNNIMTSKIVGNLRADLVNRMNEVENRTGDGVYLLQVYPNCEWTPDVPYDHIVGIEVSSYGETPFDMIQRSVRAGRFLKFSHNGPESDIGSTYDFINAWLQKNGYGIPRAFDMEYCNDINQIDSANNQIDIYVPVNR